jgi:hypothetical protein
VDGGRNQSVVHSLLVLVVVVVVVVSVSRLLVII